MNICVSKVTEIHVFLNRRCFRMQLFKTCSNLSIWACDMMWPTHIVESAANNPQHSVVSNQASHIVSVSLLISRYPEFCSYRTCQIWRWSKICNWLMSLTLMWWYWCMPQDQDPQIRLREFEFVSENRPFFRYLTYWLDIFCLWSEVGWFVGIRFMLLLG